MKKIVSLAALLLLLGAVQAQKNESVPPPPPPPEPPKVEMKKITPPKIVPDDEETRAFYKRNENVKRLAWQQGHIAIVTLKNKTVEKYDLNKTDQKKNFEEKYGEAPIPPPPPSPAPPTKPSNKQKEVI